MFLSFGMQGSSAHAEALVLKIVRSQRGTKTLRSMTTTMRPMAMPTTARGLILTPFSFSTSKYLIRPAEDWNPLSFFFAMGLRYLRPI